MRAVAYIRTEGGSPAEQRSAIESWAAREAALVLAWQIDAGVGGATPIAERPGLTAAYRAIREHRAGVLVAANAACFSHDELVAWLIERAALSEGATLVTADGLTAEPRVSPAPRSYTRGAVDLARAYDRVVVRGRIRATQADKRARGERIGNVPYGYRVAADGVHTEPDPAEQEVLATVRRLASEGLSQRAIVLHLAAAGVAGRTGSPLGQTQVSKLLRR
ncbi:MAG: recombinase family protein [Labilithrix sp.]|nr:recombinase family protein [Labilithrix sp.]MCW5815227.1 recombinase family protein [Labilithrix sp.]